MIRNQLLAPSRRSSVGVTQQTKSTVEQLQIDQKDRTKADKLSVEDGRTLKQRLKETDSQQATTHRQALIDKILGKEEYA